MATFMVHISASGADHDYAPLWSALDRVHACRAFEKVWFVDTYQPVEMFTRAIERLLSADDRIFLLQMTDRALVASRGMTDEAQHWLQKRRS